MNNQKENIFINNKSYTKETFQPKNEKEIFKQKNKTKKSFISILNLDKLKKKADYILQKDKK